MKVTKTVFDGLLLLEPRVYSDSRGFFMESFNEKLFQEHEIDLKFVQDNQSHSVKSVIRGLHFQKPPYAQTKLVRALYGTVLDVVVDLRKNQSTYGKYLAVELSGENKRQLLVPKGFAHGFSVLSDVAGLFYKCDEYYNPNADAGLNFDDQTLGINWQVDAAEAIVSPKDKSLPLLRELPEYF